MDITSYLPGIKIFEIDPFSNFQNTEILKLAGTL